MECGDDGCGGSCGVCDEGAGELCVEGVCIVEVDPPPPAGACTNEADQSIIDTTDVQGIAQDCALSNFGNEPAATECIKNETGLTQDCVVCFQGIVGCAFANCIGQCAADPSGGPCDECLQANCYPAFTECSGLDP